MKPFLLFAAVAVVAPSLTAQMPELEPPEQLHKFDRLIGAWDGAGKVCHVPGEPAGDWTSKSVVEPILGGMFLRDSSVISFPDQPQTLQFVTLYGYDRENQKYMQWSVSNMGEVTASEIHWIDDDTFVTAEIGVSDHTPHVDRWVTHLGDDEHTTKGETAGGAGSFFVHVDGTMKRAKAMDAVTRKDASFYVPGAGPEMKRLNRMAGTYDVKGTMFLPDGSETEIEGVQTMRPFYSGLVLESYTSGRPGNYEAWSWIGWNAHEHRYEMVYANSMGEAGHHPMYWVDDDLVALFAGRSMGQPTVRRSASSFDENGAVNKSWTHVIVGTGEPARVFEANYAKR
ncbi:MAG: DUF1579 family protein [Planctomycetes bacterium]|nr:DUF1579 family protein [Planctomycetota bacterium]